MNHKVYKTLEYTKIKSLLMEHASSKGGKQLCEELEPMNHLQQIQKELTETSDGLSRLWHGGRLSFSGVTDITASVKRLEVGGTLSQTELLEVSKLLDTALKVKSFGRGENDEENADSLTEYFQSIEPLSQINNELKRCIVSEEEMADDASSTLHSIRRSMRNTNDKIRSQLNSMVNSQNMRTNLQDFVITMRNGRYCLPVKADCKGNVPGMVHDQSSTGSTLFVEPMSIVQMNNELRELSLKEKDEIERILAELSALVGEKTEELKNDLTVLTHLDFVFAKASLSKEMKGSEPVFNQKGIVKIKQGRHPLLDAKKVVPIDIHLGDTFDQLIITGPNTGGKTVSLKTVGLFELMGLSGLHIPADEGSELALFTEIYADIGDEQSIEQSLSTFSSHMTNIIQILNQADDKSLVLFDEICAGTDPVEGAALAISILTFLHNMKVRTMTTTHYSELKLFALSTEGIENACCEFSVETLSPTYRLLIGIPGKSNAFAISSKLGLPQFIIDDAKTRIDSDNEAFEDILSDLEHSKLQMEREQAEISQNRAEIEALKKELHEKNQKLNDRREGILRDANEEAARILAEAKDFADETIKKVNKLSQGVHINHKELENERHKVRNKMNEAESKLALKNTRKPEKKYTAEDFHPGDAVKVLSLNLNGTVCGKPNAKGDVFVQMGILRSQVNIRDLEPVDEPVITAPNLQRMSSGKIKMSKSASISTEINLIGMTTDEAIPQLDKYLDDAYLAHLPSVRVVHGRGTGALRAAVHKHLKRLKYVKSFRLGEYGEGDTGVTIVEFK
ncbi:MAG: endonuclease MutS2 [Lachnospiraceae bacterium]|nr:endonuclease MutS2 [Lachnospiraceae bacterium]